MREHVSLVFPKEACGLLAGIANRVLSIFPVKNIENDDHRYRMDPLEQLTCFLNNRKTKPGIARYLSFPPPGTCISFSNRIAEAYYRTPLILSGR